MIDTWNLRHNASFEVAIAPELFWVPINYFGCCSYTKQQLKKIMNDLPQSASKLHNLYEIVAGFQIMEFEEKTTNVINEYNKYKFEFYETPDQSICRKYGACSGISSWCNYLLSRMFEKTGYITIIRSTHSGHSFNYFLHENFYYIIDLNLMLKKYKKDIPIEDGKLQTFRKSKFFTGCLFKTKDLKYFVNFYEAYTAIANVSFLFFKVEDYCLPPMYMDNVDEQIILRIKSDKPFEILNKRINKSLFHIEYIK